MDATCRRCLSSVPSEARACPVCAAPIPASVLADAALGPAPTTSAPVSQPLDRTVPGAAAMTQYQPPQPLAVAMQSNPYPNFPSPDPQRQQQQQSQQQQQPYPPQHQMQGYPQQQMQPYGQPQQPYPQPIQVVVQNQINVPYPAPYPQYGAYPMQYPPGYGYPMVPYVRRRDPGIATLISFFLPGGGQFYNGQVGKGLAFLLVTIFVNFPLMFVGVGFFTTLITWIWSMIDAHGTAERINRGELMP